MKQRTLLFKAGVVLVSLFLSGFASINAQNILYSNDFEPTQSDATGLNGSTIVGNGVIEDSGNAAYGKVFHNAAGGQATRTNYLTLPSAVFADLQTAATNELTISFWVNKGTATNYYWSPIFSAYAAAPTPNNGMPMMVLQVRGWAQTNVGGTWCDFTDAQNVNKSNAIGTGWIDDANWHFYTATFSATSLKVYVDGVIQNEWVLDGTALGGSNSGLFTSASSLAYICLGGNQAWNWNDPDPAFLYDKLKIYDKVLTASQINSLKENDNINAPVLVSSKTSLAFDDIYNSTTIVVNGANLTDDITITAPTGINVSPTTISKTAVNDISVQVTYDGFTTVNGNITLTSGSKIVNVAVKSLLSNSCFTPLYQTGNMIADPTFSYPTLSAGGFGGWGPTGISSYNPACGSKSAYVLGSCWPDGGSIDRSLSTANGNALEPNTTYRLRAMINSQASEGTTFQFQIEGYDGGSSIYFPISKTAGWTQFDETFTTGATIVEKGIYFNSCTTVSPAITDTCFIDNYELYKVPTPTRINLVNVNSVTNFVRENKLVTTCQLQSNSDISISLYNVNGILIDSKITNGKEGKNEIVLKTNIPTGIYIVQTIIDGVYTINKIAL